jgi:hypothetical protein
VQGGFNRLNLGLYLAAKVARHAPGLPGPITQLRSNLGQALGAEHYKPYAKHQYQLPKAYFEHTG